jgi:uncharacterized protein HemY
LIELAWSFVSKGATDAYVAEMDCKAAERALRLSPKNGIIMNTLGIAYYRTGHWQDAIDTLEKSMALRLGGDANDWFFLAMAHWQLGHKDEARQWYDKAVEWMEKNQSKNEELRRF